MRSADAIEWTYCRARHEFQNVGVDHRRAHVAMPEELLHGADVRNRLEHVRCERMAQRVRRNLLLA